MKPPRHILLIFLLSSIFLSSCSRSLLNASSWPGVNVADSTVYIANNTTVSALNIENGNLIWQYPEKEETKLTFFAKPQILDDQVIVGDYTQSLHSINIDNGLSSWTFAAKNRWIGSVLIEEETIYAPSTDHTLYTLDSNGDLLWEFTSDNTLWAAPATNDTMVFLPSMDHFLYAIDKETGKEVWKTDLEGSAIASPTVDDNETLYIGTLAKELIAMKKSNGKILWRYPTEGSIWASPILYNEALYFGDATGVLHAVNAQSGNALWTLEIGGTITGEVGILSDGIVVSSDTGELVAINYDGKKMWTRSFDGKLYSGPIVYEDYVIIAITGGENLLVALDQQGNELWSFAPSK